MNDLDSIDQVAAEWAGRISAGLSPAEERELNTWLRRDPRHSKALARMEGVSRALDQLSAHQAAGDMDADPDLTPLVHRRRWLTPAFATAAAIAILFSSFAFYRLALHDPSAVATAVGEFRTKQLPDGSVIELNTDTELRVRYTGTERRIEFSRGEARFTVAKDASRPFNVVVGGVTVQAVGTVFNVRLRSDAVEVLVTEGKVKLDDTVHQQTLLPPDALAGGPPNLAAGQRATVPVSLERARVMPTASASIAPLSEDSIAKVLAWEHRRLVFDPTPLSTIVAEFNRYNAHKLVIGDPSLGDTLVGGTFDTGDYAALTRLLETGFGVSAQRTSHETVLRRR